MKSNTKHKKAEKQFEIILRPKLNIKSRQWWTNQSKKIKCLLLKYMNQKKGLLVKNSAFTLLVTNNKEIQELNKKFRQINKPTDVLSFHLNKKEQINNEYLGDIVISSDYAAKEAKRKKINIETELSTLLIHGYLHLLGYDHKLQKEAKIMFSLQNKLLLEMIFY